jgi:hypothetical protein
MKKGSRLAALIRASDLIDPATTFRTIKRRLSARTGGVFLTEALDTTGGINNLLFACVERVALRAHLDVQRLSTGRTRSELVAAAA